MERHPENRCFFINLRHFGAVLLWLFCIACANAAAYGQSADSLDRLFTIREIRVDITARNASDARDQAFQKAEEVAFEKLLSKITQPSDRGLLPAMSLAEKRNLISGIEVKEEQSSSNRYLATLDVRFEPSLFSNFLTAHNVSHVLTTGSEVLVLHLHNDSISDYLWEPTPDMQQARASVDWVNRIRGYVFPRGELRERMLVTTGEVASQNASNALKLAGLYNAKSVLYIVSRWENTDENGETLFYQFLASESGLTHEGAITLQSAGMKEQAMTMMLEQILEIIDQSWREQLLVDRGQGGSIAVLVPSTSLAYMAELEKRLASVSLIQKTKTVSMGLPFSHMYIEYAGKRDQLILALKFASLSLREYGNDYLLEIKLPGEIP